MPRKFSSSLRWRVVRLHLENRTAREIAGILAVGMTFVKKIIKIYQDTKGVESSPRVARGRPRSLIGRDMLIIRNLADQYPELYLDEMRDWIRHLTGESYSLSTISRYLRRIGLSVKKLHLIAKERNEIQRAEYRRFIAGFDTHQLLFIDESSKNDRTFQRKYGQGLKGTRVSRKGNFTKGSRYSVLAAISVDGVKISQTIVGAYDRHQFEYAMEHFIVPLVGSYAQNERYSVVVMDNCNIHFSDAVFNMIRAKGGIVAFLPPYSPDLNPIEECFSVCKAWLQRHQATCQRYPKRCFEIALSQVSSICCRNIFTSCGYM